MILQAAAGGTLAAVARTVAARATSDAEGPGTVYLDYTQQELDAALDQPSHAPNWRDLLKVYEERSAAAQRLMPPDVRRYGDDADEYLDIYRAKSSKPAPILLFFHGGGWRMMSRRDVAYAAGTFVDAGVHFVAPGYSLRPKATLLEMAEQCRRAVLWAHANAHAFNGDPRQIYVGGLSAGAQLAGVLIATDWRAHGLKANAIRGALLVSGIYDVAALAASTVYGYTNIERADIAPLSVMHRAESVHAFVTLAWGEKEPPEFARQSRAFEAALDAAAKPHRAFIAPRRNHFEIALELADATSELSRLALQMMREHGT